MSVYYRIFILFFLEVLPFYSLSRVNLRSLHLLSTPLYPVSSPIWKCSFGKSSMCLPVKGDSSFKGTLPSESSNCVNLSVITVLYRGVYLSGHSAGAHLVARALDSSLKKMLSLISEVADSMIKGRSVIKSVLHKSMITDRINSALV